MARFTVPSASTSPEDNKRIQQRVTAGYRVPSASSSPEADQQPPRRATKGYKVPSASSASDENGQEAASPHRSPPGAKTSISVALRKPTPVVSHPRRRPQLFGASSPLSEDDPEATQDARPPGAYPISNHGSTSPATPTGSGGYVVNNTVEPTAGGRQNDEVESTGSDHRSDSYYTAVESLDGRRVVSRRMPLTPETQQIRRHTVDEIAELLGGHDNLVQLVQHVGFGTANNHVVTTWQRTEGPSLADLISAKMRPGKQFNGLSESFVWHTVISLLRAIVYLQTGRSDHEDPHINPNWQPLVHNSISPANIFYSPAVAGQEYKPCKLGNFSKCAILPRNQDPDTAPERQERLDAFPVIPEEQETGYEAPEIFREEDHVPGPASDLWSIGAVAVTMMSGCYVWDFVRQTAFEARIGRDNAQLHESWRHMPARQRHLYLEKQAMHAEIVRALPQHYSYELKEFVEALLFFDPEDRGLAVIVLEDAVARYEAVKARGSQVVQKKTLVELGEESVKQTRAHARLPANGPPADTPMIP
ncbi:uncharacterized protein LTR77_007621 [Saxophila tyrrhenica]|uniref:non-specific serine/threonine protein kinase n=1 Tax=Saxophila tyrrhenica TaxID=1690608 RepID=A0AAV9P2J6_9PEZI|nr:hypothetical protein LTR77_007621 [Saxophila tyrrhenica]